MSLLTLTLILLVALVLVNVVLFVSRRFSPIPYFPTNNKDLALIVKTLKLKSGDVLYDLGAGDGTVIMEAARQKGVRVVGVEIHPLLIAVMHIRRLFHKNKHNIRIIWGDIFKTDLKNATKIYLYVGPFVMKRLIKHISGSKSSKLRQISSYMYDFKFPKKHKGSRSVAKGVKTIYTISF